MTDPIITPLNYTYKKEGTDVSVINFEDIPIPVEQIKDRQLIKIGPGSAGGNHQHSRTEWFVAFGELEFVWLDEAGHQHTKNMNPEGKLFLFEVPPWLPHAVRNSSQTETAILFEQADAKLIEVTKIKVI